MNGKVLLLYSISFQADPNDEIWAYENVAQIKYAEKQNKVVSEYIGADVVSKLHGQVEYISNYGLLMNLSRVLMLCNVIYYAKNGQK